MTARILLVGLGIETGAYKTALEAEYFEVTVAREWKDALSTIAQRLPDLVLAAANDGGLLLTELIRSRGPKHLPVVLITEPDHEACERAVSFGADDILVAPVFVTSLFARVRSILLLRMMEEEVERYAWMATGAPSEDTEDVDQIGPIYLVDDSPETATRFVDTTAHRFMVLPLPSFDELTTLIAVRSTTTPLDLVIVNLATRAFDPLKLCSLIKSERESRLTPLMVLGDAQSRSVMRSLEMGVNDFVSIKATQAEILSRIQAQIRRKRLADRLGRMMAETFRAASSARNPR